MQAITLWQPYASLIALGAKTIETRSWSTDYRGDLAIHAGVSDMSMYMCYEEPSHSILRAAGLVEQRPGTNSMPRSAIVAVVRLFDCRSTKWAASAPRALFPPHEWEFGDYGEGRFMWLTDQLRRLPTPVPCSGAQRLWTLPAEVEAQVFAQIDGVPA